MKMNEIDDFLEKDIGHANFSFSGNRDLVNAETSTKVSKCDSFSL